MSKSFKQPKISHEHRKGLKCPVIDCKRGRKDKLV